MNRRSLLALIVLLAPGLGSTAAVQAQSDILGVYFEVGGQYVTALPDTTGPVLAHIDLLAPSQAVLSGFEFSIDADASVWTSRIAPGAINFATADRMIVGYASPVELESDRQRLATIMIYIPGPGLHEIFLGPVGVTAATPCYVGVFPQIVPCTVASGDFSIPVATIGFEPGTVPVFTEISAGTSLADPGPGGSVAWGDGDNDGDPDLYLTNLAAANILFENVDGEVFAPVGTGGIDDALDARSGVWGDHDNDGYLDLLLSNHVSGASRLFNGDADWAFRGATPQSFEGVAVGQGAAWVDYDLDGLLDVFLMTDSGYSDQLLRNEGGDVFLPVESSQQPIESGTVGRGVAWADIDNDGDQDLFAAVSGSQNHLVENEAGISFSRIVGDPLGDSTNGFGLAWGDYDNDGFLDAYVTNIGAANRLFRNLAGAGFEDVTAPPLDDPGPSTGAAWADVDNDGDLDLYLVNHGSANRLFRNEGVNGFFDVTTSPLDNDGNGMGVAWADIDGDGDLDLYLANQGQPNCLFRNEESRSNHWLQLDLQGTVSNRAAIGARVTIVAGELSQIREVSGGSGWISQDSPTIEFGLGTADLVDEIHIRWPSGTVQELESVPANQRLLVVEPGGPTGIAADLPVTEFRLGTCIPNPFNPSTRIPFDLPAPARVSLKVYDVKGRVVRTVLKEVEYPAGSHQVHWNGETDLGTRPASGVYFCRFESRRFAATTRMVLMK